MSLDWKTPAARTFSVWLPKIAVLSPFVPPTGEGATAHGTNIKISGIHNIAALNLHNSMKTKQQRIYSFLLRDMDFGIFGRRFGPENGIERTS
jgi:hypothetical protein